MLMRQGINRDRKINSTKNFNEGDIVVTPKRNSLHKNTSYDVQIINIGSPTICIAHSLTQPSRQIKYDLHLTPDR